MVMVANVQSSSSDRNDPSPGRPSHHRDTKQTKIFWKERCQGKSLVGGHRKQTSQPYWINILVTMRMG